MKITNNASFKTACIVGYGNHARNKIIPALKKANINLKFLISSKKIKLDNIIIFNDINKALDIIDKKTLIIICSPPHLHAKQSILFIKHGFNVIVEKPIALNEKEIREVILETENFKVLLIENFMYEHTKMFKKVVTYFKKEKTQIDRININFIIPALKYKSFRNSKKFGCSFIFDIGSYVISILNHLNIKYSLHSSNIRRNKNGLENLHLTIPQANKKKIIINFGYGIRYKNNIIFTIRKKKITFDKIFYGAEAYKNISYKSSSILKVERLFDVNGFENIFSKKIIYWKKKYKKNHKNYLINTIKLQELNNIYNK